jgi:hypothetical protein
MLCEAEVRFKTDTPDPDWASRQRERKNTPDAVHDNDEVEQLKRMLLRYGGWAANIDPDDPDLTNLIKRGVIMAGKGAMRRRGKPVNCHCNASELWIDGLARICTGYTMGRDGLWRQHSWGLTTQGQIIETTERRIAYFGFVLTDEEAKQFVKQNPPR